MLPPCSEWGGWPCRKRSLSPPERWAPPYGASHTDKDSLKKRWGGPGTRDYAIAKLWRQSLVGGWRNPACGRWPLREVIRSRKSELKLMEVTQMREACLKSESLQPLLAPSTSGAHCACAGEAAGEFSSSRKPECAAPIVENPQLESGVRIALLIPAYQPSPALIDLVQTLCAGKWEAIVVVDDGSGPEYTWLFKTIAELPKVKIIPHAVNLGKGSALKTVINTILCAYPGLAGIVTADADGQHDPADIRQVASRFQESPEALVLGVRSFKVILPLRSRIC